MLDFVKTNVSPGEPVTAQAWNAIVDGLFEAQAVLKAGAGTVRVKIMNTPFDTAAGRVTAERTGVPPAEAIRPVGTGAEYVFPRLGEGAYQVRAEALGFAPALGSVTVDATGAVTPAVLELTLTANAEVMPNVLGLKLPAAAAQLQTIRPRILDAVGTDLPLTGFDPDYNDAPVIMQWPDAGEIAPATGSLVVVAAVIKPPPLVSVPNLINLTLAEATTALANLGLTIKITT
jgi:hypothetical protein